MVPGKPLFFATAMTLAGSAVGLLVESREGRPIKIEGNPKHPASLGASDIFSQASLLTLYDPDRSGPVTFRSDVRPWNALLNEIRTPLERQRLRRGAGLRLLTETVVSPTLALQIRNLLREFPEARWHQYEPVNRDAARRGARQAFGRDVNTVLRVEKADVILSLDADFLSGGAGRLRYAREFASRRRPQKTGMPICRLYAVECTPSATGAKADHRLPLRASEIAGLARSLAAEITGVAGGAERPYSAWLRAVARDLLEHRGASLVIAGEQQPAAVHAWAHWINHLLGNSGSTVFYTEPIEAAPTDQISSLRDLVSDMDAGKVEWLVILGGNPVYNAPVDFEFGRRLLGIPVRMHLGLYPDETSALCHWHIPEAHYLEAWSDTRAFDGAASIVQPLIAPLWNGKSAHELLAAFTDQPERSGYDIVREYWKTQRSETDFEFFWRKSLNDGIVEGTAFAPVSISPKENWAAPLQDPVSAAAELPQKETLEIVFRPDATIFDGRFANNGWLQEIPKPITRLTWDNAALLSPATAEKLGVGYKVSSTGGEHGQILADVVEINLRGPSLRVPVWIVPGQADDCLILHLGYGRTRAGRVGNGAGFNTYRLRASSDAWIASGAALRRTGQQFPLACVQFHHNMEGRELIRAVTLSEFQQNANLAQGHEAAERPLSLYPEYKYEGYARGMAIDLNACVGCNAC
ncbi:MAG: molybdopterin oxidoreductase, partial [Acidobacteria bacterium]|nr:molybdopterin oxidoreductase [Acidobacteriota bacterium]